MRILFVSHTDASGPFRVGSHHYAREVRAAGHEVLHLATPVSLAHRITGRARAERIKASTSGARVDADGVMHWTPRRIAPAGLSRTDYPRLLAAHLSSGEFDIAFIDQPLMWDASLREVARRIVYRPTDTYEVGLKARAQARILAAADAVVATSDYVAQRLPPHLLPTSVIANGVEFQRFRSADSPRGKRAVYVGALDRRFSWSSVLDLARSHPDWQFSIVGPRDSQLPTLPPNVETPGAAAYDRIPALLATYAIGILPLSDDHLNLGRSPMKLYEYLAAGLYVVSRATPGIVADARHGILTYDSGLELQRAFATAATCATGGANLAGRELARTMDWGEKARRLLAFAVEVSR